MAHDAERKALARYLDEHHLKHTKQRDAIVEHFLEATGHVTGEELYEGVRKQYPSRCGCPTGRSRRRWIRRSFGSLA